MQRFTIQYTNEPCESCCPACGALNVSKKGPRLFPMDSDEPICRDCGKRLAPNLVALLDLANVADPEAHSLIDQALAEARKQKIRVVALHSTDEGRPLYESNGFRRTNEMFYVEPVEG